jgi:hypothetical protein
MWRRFEKDAGGDVHAADVRNTSARFDGGAIDIDQLDASGRDTYVIR